MSVPLCVAAFGVAMVQQKQSGNIEFEAVHYVLMFATYFVNYLVIVFFNSALVACAYAGLRGEPVTVGYGLSQAGRRLPQIVGWSLIAATVGTILRAISERSGIVGTIVTSLIGLAWNVAVFFVVPLLVLEGMGPVKALKESAVMLKRTWGERIILGVGLGLASLAFSLFGFLLFFGGTALLVSSEMVPGISLIAMAVLYFLVLAVVFSALGTIFQTALFSYCRYGETPRGFSDTSIQGAFVPKTTGKIFGM